MPKANVYENGQAELRENNIGGPRKPDVKAIPSDAIRPMKSSERDLRLSIPAPNPGHHIRAGNRPVDVH